MFKESVPNPERKKSRTAWDRTPDRYAQPFPRPDAKSIAERAKKWKAMPRYEKGELMTGTYEDVLREVVAVATHDYSAWYAAPWLYVAYGGWEIDDFNTLFSLLGENVGDLQEQRDQNKQSRLSRGYEQAQIGRLVNSYCTPEDTAEILAKLAQAAKNPETKRAIWDELGEHQKSRDWRLNQGSEYKLTDKEMAMMITDAFVDYPALKAEIERLSLLI